MSAAVVSGPLVGRWLPAQGVARATAVAAVVILGSLLLWASAKVSVPFWPVPMTLQTGAVALIAATCGWRIGLATVLLYLAEGAAGLPVFEATPQKGIGLPYMLGPTGGYLFGMVLQVVVTGWIVERIRKTGAARMFGAMLAGDALVFVCGLAWLGTVIGWDKPVLQLGLYPFILGDLVKLGLAACLAAAAGKLVSR